MRERERFKRLESVFVCMCMGRELQVVNKEKDYCNNLYLLASGYILSLWLNSMHIFLFLILYYPLLYVMGGVDKNVVYILYGS